MPITGSDHALMSARLGVMRLGASRLGAIVPRIVEGAVTLATGTAIALAAPTAWFSSLALATGQTAALAAFRGKFSTVEFSAGQAFQPTFQYAFVIIGSGGLLLSGTGSLRRHVRIRSLGGAVIGPTTSASEAFHRKYALSGLAGPRTQITGTLYNPLGAIVTSGELILTPVTFFTKQDFLCSANVVEVPVPGTGLLDFVVVPGAYLAEFDPYPLDTQTPRALKQGYFSDHWAVPDSYQSTVLAKTGLMAYWRVSNSGLDASGFGHTLTLTGLTSGAGGLADGTNAAVFAGTTGSYGIVNPFSAFSADEITVEMLVKTTGSDMALFSYGVTGRLDEVYVAMDASGRLVATVRGTTPVVALSGAINDDAYHHVAMTWRSASGTLRLYMDTALIVQGTRAADALLGTTGVVVLGQRQGTLGGTFTKSFSGRLDEVSIYDRVLLQPELSRNAAMRSVTAVTIGSL